MSKVVFETENPRYEVQVWSDEAVADGAVDVFHWEVSGRFGNLNSAKKVAVLEMEYGGRRARVVDLEADE